MTEVPYNPYCIYPKQLIDKLNRLNTDDPNRVDLTTITKAIHYAQQFHSHQKRQSGEPFYTHPLAVAYMVADYLFKTDIITTAILHDTLEDTTLTKAVIEGEFGQHIANQVSDLTRITKDKTISSAKLIEQLYKDKKYDLLLVKLLDRLHNLQTLKAKSPERIQAIIKETIHYFVATAIYLEIPEIEQQIVKLCNEQLFSEIQKK